MSQFKFPRTLEEELLFDTPELIKERYNTSAYGAPPGSRLPNWVKQGYNQSLQGAAQAVVRGEKVFDVDEDYDPNILEDIAATIVSFVQPLDVATLALGGGFGGAAVKKIAVNQLVKSGTRREVAARAVNIGSKKVLGSTRAKALGASTQLGFYTGISSALNQEITDGDINFLTTFKDAAKGAALGAVSGVTAVKATKYAKDKNLNNAQTIAVQKVAENFAFGTTQPALEGHIPTLENYVHAAGIIGGLTVANKGAKGILNVSKEKIDYYKGREALRISARKEAEVKFSREQGKETWTDGKKEYKIITDYLGNDKKTKHIEVKDVKTKEKTTINRKEFFGNFSRLKDKFGNDIEARRRSKFFGIAIRDLKLSDKQIKNAIDRAIGQESKLEKSPKKGRQYKTGYNKLNNEQKNKALSEMEVRASTERILRQYEKAGISVPNTSGISLSQKSLPEFVYNVLSGRVKKTAKKIRNVLAPLDKIIDTPVGKSALKLLDDLDVDNAVIFSRLHNKLSVAKYTAKNGKVYSFEELTQPLASVQGAKGGVKAGLGIKSKRKKIRDELADDLETGTLDAKSRTQEIRTVLNLTYRAARATGIKLAPYIENYFPKIVQPKILKKVFKDLDKFQQVENLSVADDLQLKSSVLRNLQRFMQSNEFSPETMRAINHIREKVLKKKTNNPRNNALAFQRLRNEVNSERVQTNKMLEKARVANNLPDDFYIRDAGYVLPNYISQAAKRMSYVKNAGLNGEAMWSKIEAISKLPGKAHQSELVRKAFNAQTNLIETDPKYNYNPKVKGFLSNAVNINVATKIGLGFASLLNITQPLISTMLQLGYSPFFRANYRALTDKKYRKDIARYSGNTQLELHQLLAGYNPLRSGITSKAAEFLTKLSGFQDINKYNKYISAASSFEAVKQWQKVAVAKPKTARQAARRDFAIKNLKELGIADVNKKLTIKNAGKAMYRFARDSQLQKNILREPNFFNSPKAQPFLLFKRFAYRQSDLIIREANKAREQKNLAFLFRLGVAGLAGGSFVSFSKNALESVLTGGQDVYDDNWKWSDGVRTYTLNDFFKGLGAVGAAGYISDILASESKWRSAEFFLKPALAGDAFTLYSGTQRVLSDLEALGFNSITARRSARYFSPLFGSVGRRALTNLETPKQRADYIRARLGPIKKEIFDSMLAGDEVTVDRIINNFNSSFPERPITYDDIGPSEINRYLERKYFRKELEMGMKLPSRKKRVDPFNIEIY